MQPARIPRVPAPRCIEEGLLDALGNGSSRTTPNSRAIDLADRGDLSGSASEERFVGREHIIDRDSADLYAIAEVARECNNGVTCDTKENRRSFVVRE